MSIGLVPIRPEGGEVIFVVEGDDVVRSALSFILGHRNETYAFATIGLAYAAAMDVTPDLVMLGVDFLKCDGEGILAGIVGRFPAAKILIVANSVDDHLALEALKCGAHEVMGKPISFDSIHRRVDRLLRHSERPTTMRSLSTSAAW